MGVADGGLVVDGGCDDSDIGEARGSQQHAHVERLPALSGPRESLRKRRRLHLGVDETAHPEEEVVIHEVLENLMAGQIILPSKCKSFDASLPPVCTRCLGGTQECPGGKGHAGRPQET